jgi:hypothetical protein
MASSPEMKQTKGLLYIYFKVLACQGLRGITIKHRVQERLKTGMPEMIDLATDIGNIIKKMVFDGGFQGVSMTAYEWACLKTSYSPNYRMKMGHRRSVAASVARKKICKAFDRAGFFKREIPAMGRTLDGWRCTRFEGKATWQDEATGYVVQQELEKIRENRKSIISEEENEKGRK